MNTVQILSKNRKALGQKNREIIEKHFSVLAMQEKYREIYEELLHEAGRK